MRAISSRHPALLLLLASLTACGGERVASDPPAGPGSPPLERPRTVGELERRAVARPPVLFVGLDGGDWELLEPWIAAGKLPNLARLRREGTWGSLATETPPLSPLLWTSMMTGVPPLEHGVLDFSRFRPGSGVREPITRDERRAPAIWNALTWAGKRVAVFGLWATHPAEPVAGTLVSDRLFGFLNIEDEPPPGVVYPPARQAAALAELREVWDETGYVVLRAYLPWLSEAEYREHAESDRPYEHPISALRRILVETELYDRLLVSSWRELAPDLAILYLQGTDSIGHVFAPYAPPRQAAVSEEDFRRYSGVAELYFRDIDRRLGALAELVRAAGGVLVVASDHGFYWGEGRPERLSSFANATAAKWHRREGIYLVHGAGIAAGRGGEVGIRSVFPTLLALAGLPAATRGESTPLPGAPSPPSPPFDYARAFEALRARAAPVEPAGDGRAAEEELAKLRALGYLGAAEPARAPEAEVAQGSTRTAGSWNNEGVILLGEGKKAEARAAFERAVEIDPRQASALWNLSDLVFAGNELDRADELLVRSLEHGLPEGVKFVVGRAIGYQRARQVERSLDLLERALTVRPEEKELWLFRGRYRVEARDCAGALDDFRRAASLAPDDPAVHASAAMAALCLGDRTGARQALQRSLEVDPDQPRVRALLERIAGGGR